MNRESRIALAYTVAFADLGAWYWSLIAWPQHAALVSMACVVIGIGCLLAADREGWK